MPDLRTRFDTEAAGLSYALSVGKIGAMIGSLLSAFMDRYGDYYDVICGALLSTMALGSLFKASSTMLWLFTLCDFLEETCWGMVGPGGQSMILTLWGTEATPYLQAMQLGFPIGGTVGPLIASLFVSQNSTTGNVSTSAYMYTGGEGYGYNVLIMGRRLNSYSKPESMSGSIINNTDGVLKSYFNDEEVKGDSYSESEDRFPDDSQIQYVFFCAAFFLFTAATGFFIFYGFYRNTDIAHVKLSSFNWRDIFSPSNWTEGEKWLGVGLLICMIVFFSANNAQYGVIATYLTSYAVDSDLGFTKQEGALLSSLLHLTGSVGRFIAIFTANCIATKILFIFHTNAGAVTAILLAIFGSNSKTSLYVFVALFGFFYRPIRGFVYGFLNFYMLMISIIFGLMQVFTNFSAIFLQALHGYLYDATVIEVIFYLAAIYGCVYVIVHVFMLVLGRAYGTLQYRRMVSQRELDLPEITEPKEDSIQKPSNETGSNDTDEKTEKYMVNTEGLEKNGFKLEINSQTQNNHKEIVHFEDEISKF